ncbi:MAG: LacI family transcriptional regulator [Anaerolineaceae bacterium]|nr:LacI family transcriptional regulator [Anaerolineaceae bacterium]
MSITIHDVAKKAGCSIKTVSRVVNDEPHVKASLRERVLAAINETGYTPNISARRLVQKRSYVICLLLHASGSFQSSLLSKVLEVGYEGNYDVIVQTYFPSFSRSRKKISNLIQQNRIDGLITTPPCDSDPFLINLITNSGLPHVHIAPLNPTGGTPYVSAEDFTGAYQMTERLINLGHQRIGILLGHRNQRPSLDRLYGYRSALEKYQINFDEKLMVDSENNFEGGSTATKILMNLQNPPDAIFALSDEAAAGALFCLHELKIMVPQQVALAAFGDLGISHQIWPGISAVRYPVEKIVERSIQMLIDLVEGRQIDSKQVIFPTSIMMRGST